MSSLNINIYARILILGNIAFDLTFMLDHLPRVEESVQASNYQGAPGGKALCQAVCASRLGAYTTLVGRVGATDHYGEEIIRFLQGSGVDASNVIALKGRKTDLVCVFLEGQHRSSYVGYPGASYTLRSEDIHALDELFRNVEAVNATFAINLDALHTAFSIAKNDNLITILRAGPPEPERDISIPVLVEILKMTDYLIVQEWEARTYLPQSDNLSIEELAESLLKHGPKNVCVTDGATSAYFISHDGFSASFIPFPEKLVDTSGATDAFCAALSASLGSGYSREDSLRIAWAAGNFTANRKGVIATLPSAFDVQNILDSNPDHEIFANASPSGKKKSGTS